MGTQRFSKANIKATTKRPEVFLYQGALKELGFYSGVVDGWFGKGSASAVKAFQEKNSLGSDGIIGKRTATELIKQAVDAGFKPDLLLRIMSVITFYEVSNRKDAFGMAEDDIGDSAGANYGFMQCNSHGSVVSVLKLAGRGDLINQYNAAPKAVVNPAIQDWFGSAEGIETQVKYFRERIVNIAMRELHDFGCFDSWENDTSMTKYWERAVLLFCDSVIQNGTMWSGSRRPFWKDMVGAEKYSKSKNVQELYDGEWWDEMLGDYIKYADFKELWWAENEKQEKVTDDTSKARKATTIAVAKHIATELIPDNDPQAKLVLLAQLRSRSSWEKYWFIAVGSRRITDATGHSFSHPEHHVNGAAVDLSEDYYI